MLDDVFHIKYFAHRTHYLIVTSIQESYIGTTVTKVVAIVTSINHNNKFYKELKLFMEENNYPIEDIKKIKKIPGFVKTRWFSLFNMIHVYIEIKVYVKLYSESKST